MKKCLFLILVVIVISSCKKDENPEPDIYNSFATAKINNEVFSFKPSMIFSSTTDSYGILLEYHIDEIILRKSLNFSFIKGETIKQSIYPISISNQDTSQCSYSTLIGDGDVLGNYYYLNENDLIEDYLELTQFNESTGNVQGTFQVSFYVDTSTIFDLNSPDTIIITDGYFETTIHD